MGLRVFFFINVFLLYCKSLLARNKCHFELPNICVLLLFSGEVRYNRCGENKPHGCVTSSRGYFDEHYCFLILLNFRSDDAAPNLSDSLFLKIFEKNKFEHIQVRMHMNQKCLNTANLPCSQENQFPEHRFC
jgi:hypothetical protein